MSIIGRVVTDTNFPKSIDAAFFYLDTHRAAGDAMKNAERAMEKLMPFLSREDRKRYGRVHKKMGRLRREWNRAEQEREA